MLPSTAEMMKRLTKTLEVEKSFDKILCCGGIANTVAGVREADMMKDYYGIAFGCPSMGAEVLEEIDFDPMWQECKKKIGGKRIALFGSYGWGDGEWMRNWADDASGSGANMVCDFVIANEEPNAEAIAECEKLAAALIA